MEVVQVWEIQLFVGPHHFEKKFGHTYKEILKEKISLNVWISIFLATIGIIIMALDSSEKNSVIGFIFIYSIIENPFGKEEILLSFLCLFLF